MAAAAKNLSKELVAKAAKDMVRFIEQSPSPFHTVQSSIKMLEAAGYTRIQESNMAEWELLSAGDKRYITRNESTLLCFAIGGKWTTGNGFTILAAHTDSPVLRTKPVTATKSVEGFHKIGVQTYGGGLWHTWFDRDLSVAGRVVVADKERTKFVTRLVRVDRPILRVPNLAIHLQTSDERKAFAVNKEKHLGPILATEVAEFLEGGSNEDDEKKGEVAKKPRHHPLLVKVLAEELMVPPESICDFELSLYDTQQPTIGGVFNEFIFAPRIDNLASTFCCLTALAEAPGLQQDTNIRIGIFFDDEEVGSQSNRGARSNILTETLRRLQGSGSQSYAASLQKSLIVSMDCAHAVHPNYAEKHEKDHKPKIQEGCVVKYNVNERYATTLESSFPLLEIARRENIPLQSFCVRQDMGCGSTIGPISAAATGIQTVDIGIAQHSMHSIRESCGAHDILSSINLLNALLRDFAAFNFTTPENQ